MNIDHPGAEQVSGLRKLWKGAFGDDDAFLDLFFGTAFAPMRCRCVTEDGQVLAALYWFDVSCRGRKLAYIYAVATDAACRNRGLCRRLMEDTALVLRNRGYAGALLVPQEEGLIRMYGGMGYEPCTRVSEFRCAAQAPAAAIRKIDSAAYGRGRADLLPGGGVLQEGENLAFLATQADFYAGPGFVAAVTAQGEQLHCMELLGDPAAAPGILAALGCGNGFFRCPGDGRPFAMLRPLVPDCPMPTYFGLAFD